VADQFVTNSSSRVDAGDVARRTFGTVRRGFDPEEVRAYLDMLANALERAGRREQELLEALAEAEERASHPVIDESVLTSSLGQHSAAVLRGAHEEAARILSQAEESAAAMVRDAQQQASDIQVSAESSAAERIAEAELEANSLRQLAHEEAAAVVETARVEGEAVVERAREHGRAMLDQAQEARRRVLADMAHRRRLITEQIEMFRAARDEIAGSVVGVRRSVDRIVEDLSHAEDSARAAAAGAASRPHAVDVPESVLVEEGERAVAELGEAGQLHVEQGEDVVPSSAAERRPVIRFDDIATVVERSETPGDEAEGKRDGVVAAPDEAVAEAAHVVPDEDMPVEAGPGADPAVGGSDVDGLFARLRARHAAGGQGDAEPGEAAAGDEAAGDEAAGEHAAGDEAAGDEAAGEHAADDDAAEVVPVADEPEPSPDAAMFARRAEVLDPITSTLGRRLKRALQDDQNGLLDRLRKGTGEWSDDLLTDPAAQRDLYAKAASAPVRDAMTAGAAFARSVVGGRRAKAAAPDGHAVDEVSGELASKIVSLIRRRLEAGEISDAAERIGAAYREWRGERIERLAEDSAVEAFSKGVLAGVGKHGLRWSRSDVGPGCADCEDNGLAGAVSPGDEFPTGHRHPPAHAGCRCLIVPTPS
jgi:DivIVA domain-containing protein